MRLVHGDATSRLDWGVSAPDAAVREIVGGCVGVRVNDVEATSRAHLTCRAKRTRYSTERERKIEREREREKAI